MTTYTYNELKKLKTFSYYSGNDLATIIKYNYSKDGRLKNIDQTLYDHYGNGKKYGTTTTNNFYDLDGKLTSRTIKRKNRNKVTKEVYTYKYDANKNLIETYVKFNKNDGEILREKRAYDAYDRLISEENYYTSTTKLTKGTRTFSMKKGDAFQKKYFYDDRGLIELEVNSVNENQRLEIQYHYKTF